MLAANISAKPSLRKGYWMRLGLTHFHAKRYEQALSAYRQALVIAPDSSFLCGRIGETLSWDGLRKH